MHMILLQRSSNHVAATVRAWSLIVAWLLPYTAAAWVLGMCLHVATHPEVLLDLAVWTASLAPWYANFAAGRITGHANSLLSDWTNAVGAAFCGAVPFWPGCEAKIELMASGRPPNATLDENSVHHPAPASDLYIIPLLAALGGGWVGLRLGA